VAETSHFLHFLRVTALVVGFLRPAFLAGIDRQSSRRPGNTRKIEKGESRVQKEADYLAIRARRDSETRTRTEAVEAEKTARVQKEQEKEQGRARREAEKKTARVQKEQEKEQDGARREAEKVARRDARTEDLAIRNERLAYVQQNADEDEGSRRDGMGAPAVLEWYEAPVCRSVKPGKSAALLAYTTQRPMPLNMKLCLKLPLRKTCGYFLYSYTY